MIGPLVYGYRKWSFHLKLDAWGLLSSWQLQSVLIHWEKENKK